jgi:hypothetical protein
MMQSHRLTGIFFFSGGASRFPILICSHHIFPHREAYPVFPVFQVFPVFPVQARIL